MKYSGLCIGGPLAGRQIECEKARMECVNPPDHATRYSDIADLLPPKLCMYAHEPVYAQGGEYGFWIPADKNAHWALEQLAAAYVAANPEPGQ